MKKTLVMLILAMLGSTVVLAQTTDIKAPKNSILSGQQEIMNEKAPSPLPPIDESNVMWKKTVIREIDFRQKINQVFYYPINPTEDWRNLITVIYDAIQSGDITPYRVENNIDDMVTPLTLADFEKENTKIGDPPVIWKDGEEVPNEIAFKDRLLNVTRLRIKEDWYFDKKLSQFLVRIIALSPVVADEDGISQTCWIPYRLLPSTATTRPSVVLMTRFFKNVSSTVTSSRKRTFTTATSTLMLSTSMRFMNRSASRTKCSTSSRACGSIDGQRTQAKRTSERVSFFVGMKIFFKFFNAVSKNIPIFAAVLNPRPFGHPHKRGKGREATLAQLVEQRIRNA